MNTMNRRTFLTGGALIASTAALGALTGCAPKDNPESGALANTSQSGDLPLSISQVDIDNSAVETETISEFASEESYDIVVVGAGCAGVPALLTALDEGATVCCLQKESKASANGAGASCVALDYSAPGAIAQWTSLWAKENNWRLNRTLFDYWASHSEETLSWLLQKGIAAGVEPVACITAESVVFDNGGTVAVCKALQPSNQELMEALCAQAEKDGAVFHYSTPAVQLIQDDGAVTGVVGKNPDGSYIKVNANRGVILATGDYMNNESLLARYNGDVVDWTPDLVNHTGDGHIMGTLAGGSIAPAPHPRQIHSLFSDNRIFLATPLVTLNPKGERFMDEECVMTDWNTAMKYTYPEDMEKIMYRFLDSAVAEKYPGVATQEVVESLVEGTIEGGGERGSGLGVGLATYKGETLEELCYNMGIDDAAPFVAAIERYNELCAKGVDEDFGVDPQKMRPIDTPPYYGIINVPATLSADNGGLLVDEHYQVVDEDGAPIPGLFAAGVVGGDICGGVNWHMPAGSSNGHCFNAGRYTVIYALTGDLKPSHPASFKDVEALFADEDGKFMWDYPEIVSHDIPRW